MAEELCYLTIAEAAERLRRRELSPVELTRAHLDRIAALDGTLQCYITVAADQALAEAQQAEREIAAGHYRGPLHGIPMAHKDNFDTAGVRTTAASRVLANHTPTRDATAIARLRAAGSVLLGKVMLSEFAFGWADPRDSIYREPRNPWALAYHPGGSSSGSAAALAAGLCMGALGGDTGGSIRGPAANCNVVGLKPTYGLVSRAGAFPGSWSLDHAGPMTRTVRDNALMLAGLVGFDPADPASVSPPSTDYTADLERGCAGLRIGVPTAAQQVPDLDPRVGAAFDAALARLTELGAHLESIDVPGLDPDLLSGSYWAIARGEIFSAHRPRLRAQASEYGRLLRRRLQLGAFVTAEEYLLGQRGRAMLRRQYLQAFDGLDLMVMPASTAPAKTFASMAQSSEPFGTSLYRIDNLAGTPALAVPCGFTDGPDPLPVGIQFAGRPFAEKLVFRAAHAYEQASPWHTKRPALDPKHLSASVQP